MEHILRDYIIPAFGILLCLAGFVLKIKSCGASKMCLISFGLLFGIMFGPSFIYAIIADESSSELFSYSMLTAFLVIAILLLQNSGGVPKLLRIFTVVIFAAGIISAIAGVDEKIRFCLYLNAAVVALLVGIIRYAAAEKQNFENAS